MLILRSFLAVLLCVRVPPWSSRTWRCATRSVCFRGPQQDAQRPSSKYAPASTTENLLSQRENISGERELRTIGAEFLRFSRKATANVNYSPNGKTLHRSSVLRRKLHPVLVALGQPKCGVHAFRRFRNAYLRNFTATPPAHREITS
jgi:hypothetical protein